MTKFKTIILVLCLTISATLCLAHHVDHQKEDGVPITVIKSNDFGGVDRSSSISASINGHNLIINFFDDIGHVLVKTEDESGTILDLYYTETPAGYLYYIPDAGHYLLTIIFGNGDEYYGEFDVVD